MLRQITNTLDYIPDQKEENQYEEKERKLKRLSTRPVMKHTSDHVDDQEQKEATAQPGPPVAQKLGKIILNVFVFVILQTQTSFERVVKNGHSNQTSRNQN